MNIKRKIMEVIVNNTSYYSLASLIEDVKYSSIFNSNNNMPERKLLQKYNVPYTEVIYAYHHNNEWKLSTSSYCRAKVLITKKWIINKLPVDGELVNNTHIASLLELNQLPKLTIEGKEVNIEVRSLGPLSLDNILFRCRDVKNIFNMNNLINNILNDSSSYTRDIDYKTITVDGGRQPYVYLTFQGLLRVIFVSRGSKVSEEIQRWIANVIYTCQYGTRQERMGLVKSILPDYAEIINDIFGKFEFTCIYLLKIGTYDKYTDVYKFGRTNNFNRRYKEHNKTYNTVCSVCLLQYVDEDYLPKAETEIHNYMSDINALIDVEGHDELVTLTDKQVKSVSNIYKHVGHAYAVGNVKLQDTIEAMRHEIELLNKDKDIQLMKKDMQLMEKDKDMQLLEKDLQLIKMENELLKLKNGITV